MDRERSGAGLRKPNLSVMGLADTAHTRDECAEQRAEHMAILGVRSVIELCVGPSLRSLAAAYARHGIRCVGNDIDSRWQRAQPEQEWIVGDALSVDLHGFDAAVFAPPLSRGCTGRREDALMIDEVTPSYREFLAWNDGTRMLLACVLPARSAATAWDRAQLHALLARIGQCDLMPLVAGRRRIVKYWDVYIDRRGN